ncbi:MAG TPA: pitrilysin family protein [Candidatus Nanoarchaeia archaeon]|nr:pitrilysin family protein [Candidatus Nanoarchaeia archaeon]
MNFKKQTLKNGLRIITVPMKDTPTATVLVLVEAGSKYETKDINGLSHFLEHMCFKGTVNRPRASDISHELDSLGAQYNAFTSQEFTGYYAKAQAKKLPQLINIIADMYVNPIFDEKEIEKEKGVIVEEINMYEDMPQRHIHDVFSELLYGDQPAGWEIAGSRENVRAMTRDHFVQYRDKHYVARGTIVIVAGKIDEEKVRKLVTDAFSSISTAKKHDKERVKESQTEPALVIKDKKTDQMHLVLGVRSFDVNDKRLPALRVLATALGGGMSSRLFYRMRDQMGVCYYVRAGTDEFTDHGMFTISAGVDKNRLIESVQAIIEECRKFIDEPLGAVELRKTKDYITGNLFLGLESSDANAEYVGMQEVLRREVKKPSEVVTKIEKVTPREVQKIAQELFVDSRLNFAVIGDVKEADKQKLKQVLTFKKN